MEARLRAKEEFDIEGIKSRIKDVRTSSIKGLNRYVRDARKNLSAYPSHGPDIALPIPHTCSKIAFYTLSEVRNRA